jgi:hypothetical protein
VGTTQLACGLTTAQRDRLYVAFDWLINRYADKLNAAGNYSNNLYDTHIAFTNAMQAAENCADIHMIDRLAYLFAIPYSFMSTDAYGYHWWMDHNVNPGLEVPLYETKYIYASAKLVNIIAHTPQSQWTPAMTAYMNVPRLEIKAQLERWLTTPTASTCVGTDRTYPLPQYVQLKSTYSLGPPVYCNASGEAELFPAAAGVEMLAATGWSGFSASFEPVLRQYIRDTVHLFESRITSAPACANGGCQGALFDVGGWHEHYSDYPANLWPNGGEVLDFSHMRMLTEFIDTFYTHPSISQGAFTFDGIRSLLSNQLNYVVFNGNFSDPAFANFWNGSNVAYRDIQGAYQQSSAYYTSGYGFWGYYDSGIRQINDSVLHIVEDGAPSTYMPLAGDCNDSDPLYCYGQLVGFYSLLTHPAGQVAGASTTAATTTSSGVYATLIAQLQSALASLAAMFR